jgi:hypothetical protein
MNYFKTILFIICFLTALFISFVYTLIHPESSLSIFYLFPISIAAWFIGRWAGFPLSLISAISWLLMVSSVSAVYSKRFNDSGRRIRQLEAYKNILHD